MKSATAEFVDFKMMMQIKLVKHGIFLQSCHGTLTLVNKLESWTNVHGIETGWTFVIQESPTYANVSQAVCL